MKRAILYIDPMIICGFNGGIQRAYKITDFGDIPKDARIVQSFIKNSSNQIGVVLESKEFEDIPNGELLPILSGPVFGED